MRVRTGRRGGTRRAPHYSYCRRCDLPHIRSHNLRHSHASPLLKAGIRSKIVIERLGYANIGITLDTYSHVLPELQQRAAKCFAEMLESRVIQRMLAKCLPKSLVQIAWAASSIGRAADS